MKKKNNSRGINKDSSIMAKDENRKEHPTKEKAWEELKKNVRALKKPRNILLVGSFGAGKSSFINTAITALTGEYNFYTDVGSGSKHNTTRVLRISREDYWNPTDETEKELNMPTFIDVIGFDDKLSTNQEEGLANSKLLNLIINGKLPENCDLLDLGKKLMRGDEVPEMQEEEGLDVDIILVVISAENVPVPQSFVDEIYKEANMKKKQIPVFIVATKVDECKLSEEGVEKKTEQIIQSFGTTPYKVLTCKNYLTGDTVPDIAKDISIITFLKKLCDPLNKAVNLVKVECNKLDRNGIHAPPSTFGAYLISFRDKSLQTLQTHVNLIAISFVLVAILIAYVNHILKKIH